MTTPGKDGDRLIDSFVQYVNARGLDPLPAEQVPLELREDGDGDPQCPEWRIRAISPNPWIDALTAKLAPNRFPQLYLSWICRYRFAEFEVGPIRFFANTRQSIFHELSTCIFQDQHMSPALLEQGLLQFGQPDTAIYDPVCFDMKRATRADAPIVVIDHEDILSRNRKVRILEEIAPSFRNFVERMLAGEFNRPE
jgi:hypothetical protein